LQIASQGPHEHSGFYRGHGQQARRKESARIRRVKPANTRLGNATEREFETAARLASDAIDLAERKAHDRPVAKFCDHLRRKAGVMQGLAAPVVEKAENGQAGSKWTA